jgi:hypothetical protein
MTLPPPPNRLRRLLCLRPIRRQGGEFWLASGWGRMNSTSRSRNDPRRGSLREGPIVAVPQVPASAAQRRKVAGSGCAVCGRSPVDPAHLVPQRLGGCPHPDCVIALCRTHHRLFDSRRMALAPYLGQRFEPEREHALLHVGAAALRNALGGGGWPPPWEEVQPEGIMTMSKANGKNEGAVVDLASALARIEREFGKGSVLSAGGHGPAEVEAIRLARCRWTWRSGSAGCRGGGSSRSTGRSPRARRR